MNMNGFSRSLRLSLQRRWPLVMLIGMGSASALLSGTLPARLGQLVDAALAQTATTSMLLWYAGMVIAVQLLRWTLVVGQTWVRGTAAQDLRGALIQHLTVLPTAFYRSHGVGELTERLEADVDEAVALPSQIVPGLIMAVVLVMTVLVTLWQKNVIASVAMAAYVVLGSVIVQRTQRESAAAWDAERHADAAAFDSIEETLSGATDIRAVQAAAYHRDALIPRLATRMQTHRTAALQQQTGTVAAGLVVAAGWMLAAGLGLWSIGTMQGTVGDALALLGAVRVLIQPMETFGTEISAFQRARAAFRRCDALFAAAPYDQYGGTPLPAGPLAVSVQGVSFHYPSADALALQDITLQIAAGEHVALVGRTGSGKTTLGRLIAKLEQPTAGAIFINDLPIETLAESAFRDRVGVIHQDLDLIPGTLRTLLCGYREDIDDTELHAALAALGLQGWIERFPDGFDTRIGDGGRVLTPGEAQIVATVRVFVQQPGLVILDEATAHIDPATEHLLQTALARLTATRTTLTIAHRRSTVAAADRLVVLADGIIVEQGAPTDLAADPHSAFSRAVEHPAEVVA